MYGICNLSIVALRLEPSDTSEMINQVLFGEHFNIIEQDKNWSKIRLQFDNFEGYIDNKQFTEISEEVHQKLITEKAIYAGELIDFFTDKNNLLTTIPLGARLPFYHDKSFSINDCKFTYEGKTNNDTLSKSKIIETAFLFLNTPYLQAGKTPFGIDADGFTQMVYKLCGYHLYRNAIEQAKQGDVLSFIEESEPGDLAFFDDNEGNIIHVGIIMTNQKIIHSYGKVRIDQLDHHGIYNSDTQKHTHKLRVIKKIL